MKKIHIFQPDQILSLKKKRGEKTPDIHITYNNICVYSASIAYGTAYI